jgi:hypothetical protein
LEERTRLLSEAQAQKATFIAAPKEHERSVVIRQSLSDADDDVRLGSGEDYDSNQETVGKTIARDYAQVEKMAAQARRDFVSTVKMQAHDANEAGGNQPSNSSGLEVTEAVSSLNRTRLPNYHDGFQKLSRPNTMSVDEGIEWRNKLEANALEEVRRPLLYSSAIPDELRTQIDHHEPMADKIDEAFSQYLGDDDEISSETKLENTERHEEVTIHAVLKALKNSKLSDNSFRGSERSSGPEPLNRVFTPTLIRSKSIQGNSSTHQQNFSRLQSIDSFNDHASRKSSIKDSHTRPFTAREFSILSMNRRNIFDEIDNGDGELIHANNSRSVMETKLLAKVQALKRKNIQLSMELRAVSNRQDRSTHIALADHLDHMEKYSKFQNGAASQSQSQSQSQTETTGSSIWQRHTALLEKLLEHAQGEDSRPTEASRPPRRRVSFLSFIAQVCNRLRDR